MRLTDSNEDSLWQRIELAQERAVGFLPCAVQVGDREPVYGELRVETELEVTRFGPVMEPTFTTGLMSWTATAELHLDTPWREVQLVMTAVRNGTWYNGFALPTLMNASLGSVATTMFKGNGGLWKVNPAELVGPIERNPPDPRPANGHLPMSVQAQTVLVQSEGTTP